MTSNNTRIIEFIDYHSPKDLIDFFRTMQITPTIKIIKENCIRYEYDVNEIKELCDEFNLTSAEFRNIRNEVYDSINPLALAVKGNDKVQDDKRINAAWNHIQKLHFINDSKKSYGSIIFGTPRLSLKDGNNPQKSMWQYAIPKSKITKSMVAKLLTIRNLYIMVNTSKTYARRTEDVHTINALYLDIDNVKDVNAFLQKCKNEGRFNVVEPSRIVSSGGGLHIYFYLKDVFANEKLNPYIIRMQKALHELYPEADKLSDLVRFLRLDGSVYDKPGKLVKFVQTIYESEQVYTVPELGPKLVDPYIPKEKKEKKKEKVREKQAFGIVPQGTWRELEFKRMKDIEYLLEIGHFDNDRRKRAIFFYGLFAFRAIQNFAEAVSMTYDLNAQFKHPLNSEEIENQLSSVKTSGFIYKYKSETVVSQLEIEKVPKEYREKLKSLTTSEIKEERKNKYKRKKRRNEKGLTSREASKSENINKIKALLQQGFKQVQIASKLNLSKSYVSTIVKQIRIENQAEQ